MTLAEPCEAISRPLRGSIVREARSRPADFIAIRGQTLRDPGQELFQGCRSQRLCEVTVESGLAGFTTVLVLAPAGYGRDVDTMLLGPRP